MLACVAASAFICVICAALGFGPFLSLSVQSQGIILLVLAVAGTFLLGAFEAYDGQSAKQDRVEDA
ncbi:MAG: hypothetical protein K2X62_12635 [Beijerinckiaceae bacterium]|jgi:hypothetical protein|nr:hypothetical protein [Beijerinckiaceae bacterium]